MFQCSSPQLLQTHISESKYKKTGYLGITWQQQHNFQYFSSFEIVAYMLKLSDHM